MKNNKMPKRMSKIVRASILILGSMSLFAGVIVLSMVLIRAVIIGIAAFPFALLANEPHTKLDDIQIERERDVAIEADGGWLHHNRDIICNSILESNGVRGLFLEVFLIEKESIWCCIKEKDTRIIWSIVSINLSDDSVSTKCKMIVNGEALTEKNGSTDWFGRNQEGRVTRDYKERTGFYYNGKIVLSDYDKVLEYDIQEDTQKEYDYDSYHFPELPINAEVDYENDAIHFTRGSIEKTLTLDRAEHTSEAFAEMRIVMADLHGAGQKEHLLYRVVSSEDHIYVLVPISNIHGTIHLMIFEYDFNENRLYYLKKCYLMEPADSDWCHVVPVWAGTENR